MFHTTVSASWPADTAGDALVDAVVEGLNARQAEFEARHGFRHTVSVAMEAPSREALNRGILAHQNEILEAAKEVGVAREVSFLAKPVR